MASYLPHFISGSLMGMLILFLLNNPLEPTLWETPFVLPKLEGVLAVNTDLQNAVRLGENIVLAPESFAMDSVSGTVFTSLATGSVVALNSKGEFLHEVFHIGSWLNNNNNNNNGSTTDLSVWCAKEAMAKRLAWNVEGEKMCGRPLGMRIVQQTVLLYGSPFSLYVLDAYHGLFTVEASAAPAADGSSKPAYTIQHLVSPSSPSIEVKQKEDFAITRLHPKFYNDLDVAADGTVFFTDSSYKWTRSQNRQEIVDAAPRGRLFAYSPSGKLSVLACGLHFPNGVQLLPNSEKVLVAELTRFRVLLIDTSKLLRSDQQNGLDDDCSEHGSVWQELQKPSLSSAVSVFVDALPGLPDNLRLDKASNKILIGLGSKSTAPFSLLHFAYQHILLRNIVGRILPMKYVEHLVPSYGLVVALSLDGKITGTLQDPGGKVVKLISEAERHPITGDLWLGSHANAYVALVKKDSLPTSFF